MNSNPTHGSYSSQVNMEGSRGASGYSSMGSGANSSTMMASTPVTENRVKPANENTKLANELTKFQQVANNLRQGFKPGAEYSERCQQAFDVANDLFGNAPTWVCFYRELMGTDGFILTLFPEDEDFSKFLRSEQYHQIQLMLTALRSRDLPENDPNDPQRMITVRLPKSLHEALCEEAGRLKISVNRLCISRMLQLLDRKMIPETGTKPRGRKPRTRKTAAHPAATGVVVSAPVPGPGSAPNSMH